MKDIFTDIYKTNYWRNNESVSGHGSTMNETASIRLVLPKLFKELHVKSVLDIPCGDCNWVKDLWLVLDKYIGGDVVEELIADNQNKFHHEAEFQLLDATQSKLPKVDLILCRDMLGHFSNRDVKAALKNFRASGSKYLLATTFPGRESEVPNIKTGEWRPIDLAYMWGLPTPLLYIYENCTAGNGKFKDKALGLWELQSEFTN